MRPGGGGSSRSAGLLEVARGLGVGVCVGGGIKLGTPEEGQRFSWRRWRMRFRWEGDVTRD